MKLLIGIPAYITNEIHLDFTQKTVASIKTSHDYEVLIIVTHCEPQYLDELKKIGELIILGENNVSKAWNTALIQGNLRGSDYILIPNNDVVFHPDCIDNLVKFANEHPEFVIWTAAEYLNIREFDKAVYDYNFDEHPHFSCFMTSNKLQKVLGEKETGTKEPLPGLFDEGFKPAYFEDGDMHQRIIRAGLKAAKTGSALFYHWGSRTIHSDRAVYTANSHTFQECREYFIRKWGFNPEGNVTPNDDPVRFKFKEPFENG